MRMLISFLVLSLICLIAGQVVADTVTGTIASKADTKERFKAQGVLTTADTLEPEVAADPAATPPVPHSAESPKNDGIGTEDFVVQGPAPDVNWEVKIKHQTRRPWAAAGARQLQVCLEGKHLDGPHPAGTPRADIDPQDLGAVCSKPQNVKFGVSKTKALVAYSKVQHKLVGGGVHIDHVGMKAVAGVLQVTKGNQVSGIYQIGIKHSPKTSRQSDLYGYSFGSGSESGSAVAYDSASQILSFTVAAIDILDSSGGLTGQIDTEYVEDPFAQGQMTVSELMLIGVTEGGYLFGPGTISVIDPAQNFELVGSFEEYFIDDTVGGKSVTSYALLDTLSGGNLMEAAEGGSPFLDAFINMNVLGEGIPADRGASIAGIDLTFMTATDLVAATEGFTVSASLPATILIALNSGREEVFEDPEDSGEVPSGDKGSTGEDPDQDGEEKDDRQIPYWVLPGGVIILLLLLISVVRARRSQ